MTQKINVLVWNINLRTSNESLPEVTKNTLIQHSIEPSNINEDNYKADIIILVEAHNSHSKKCEKGAGRIKTIKDALPHYSFENYDGFRQKHDNLYSDGGSDGGLPLGLGILIGYSNKMFKDVTLISCPYKNGKSQLLANINDNPYRYPDFLITTATLISEKTPNKDKKICVSGIHIKHGKKKNSGFKAAQISKQLDFIKQQLQTVIFNNIDIPVILAGDFNTHAKKYDSHLPKESKWYNLLKLTNDLNSTIYPKSADEPKPTFRNSKGIKTAVDYIISSLNPSDDIQVDWNFTDGTKVDQNFTDAPPYSYDPPNPDHAILKMSFYI